jgi:hypothetical protein
MATSPNRRQRIIQFTTPKVSDLVVVEVVDASKNVNSADSADDNAYGAAHPDDTRFPNFKLAFIKSADDRQGQFQYWYYIKDRDEQDKYNWEFQSASASMRYDSVVRTYVLPRYGSDPNGAPASGEVAGTDYFEESAPVLNTSMPSTIHDPFGGGVGSATTPDTDYVLFEKKQVRSGDEILDSLYVVEQRVYVKKVPIRRIDIDPEFSVPLRSKETLYYSGETLKKTVRFKEPTDEMSNLSPSVTVDVATKKGKDQADMWGTFREAHPTTGTGSDHLTADSYFGIYREVRQLSNNWFAVAEREVIKTQRDNSSGSTNQGVEGLVESFFYTDNFRWPAVLASGTGADAPVRADSWARNAGGADTVLHPNFIKDEYYGPTKMKVERFWSATAFTEATSTSFSATALQKLAPMMPETIEFQTPIFKIRIKPTLHGQIQLSGTSGTNHPVYAYNGTTFTYPATHNHTDWPTSIVVKDNQKRFRGGYLRERITAYKPHQPE